MTQAFETKSTRQSLSNIEIAIEGLEGYWFFLEGIKVMKETGDISKIVDFIKTMKEKSSQ